jgi:alcohol dehydrogenase
MRALVLGANGTLSLDDVATPHVEGECRIRVTAAGICGTDLHLLDGYAGFSGTPGHEFVGVVESAPASEQRWIGTRVVGEINVGCGKCEWCTHGIKEHCPSRTVVGIRGRQGAFAEFVSLPASNLHRVPDGVDDETAVFVEPVAAACRMLEQVELTDETHVAVIGDGRLGLLAAQVIRTRTNHVTLFGRHAHKLNVARALGLNARTTMDAHEAAFDVVVDATGRADGFARAVAMVKPRGTIVLKSTFHGDVALPLWPLPVHEVTVVGSRCGPFAPALALLASGQVRTAPLVHATFALADYERAFATARRELKVLFDPQGSTTTARRM